MLSEILNGVKVYVPSSREELMKHAFEHNSILVAVNAEKIEHATNVTRAIINRNLGYSDGIGAVWALNRKGHKGIDRIPGCELWLDIVAHYHDSKSFYLIGGKDAIITATVEQLKETYPNINIVNYRNGFLKDDAEKLALIDDIVQKKPDVVFVAMGSPRQELLMEEMSIKHKAVYQGLGGSFDVYTGLVKRAPQWWLNNNLEGVYRLLQRPGRVMRDLKLLPFIYKLIFNKF